MSEWNLSVRLTGRGSSLANTLRDVASDARAASNEINALRRNLTLLRTEASNNISVRLDVDADHLRADVSAALTTAGSGQGLRVRLDLDADHLRDEVNTALTTAGAGQGLAVNLRLTDANQLRRDVENAVRWAAWGHRIEIPIGLRDPNALRNQVTAAVRRAQQNQTVRIRVTADTSDLRNVTRGLNNRGGGGGGGGSNSRGLLAGLLTLAPAAIPLAAGLSAQLAPLAAQFTAAGVAGAAFGIAIAGQIEPLSNAADAEKKYQEAVVQHGRNSKEALEASLAYQQQLSQLSPASQKAAIALSTLKGDFSDWSNDMSRFTMEPVTHGITVLDQLIPHLTPEVKSASTQLDRLVTVAGGAISTPGFDAFSNRLAKFTDGKLDELTDEVIHLMRVLSEGGADHGVIAAFVDYARANGPAAREALKQIAQAVITLVEGAAQAGPGLLTLVTAAARLVAALPPELVGIILHVAAALKLLQLSGAGMAALAGGLARVRTQIASLSAASAAAGGGLAGLRAAFMSLGVAARASIIIAAIAAVVVVMQKLGQSSKAAPDVDRMTTAIGNLGRTGKVTGEALRVFGKDMEGLAYAADRVGGKSSGMDKFNDTMNKILSLGMAKSNSLKDAEKDIDSLDKSLANLVSTGHADLAAAALKELQAAYAKKGGDPKKLAGEMDDYKSALADAALEQRLTADSMGLFGQAAQDTQAKLDAQKKSADGLRQSIQALNDVNRAGAGAMNAFEQSIDDAAKAAKNNAGALKMHNGELDLGSQKARDAESALRDLASNTDDAAAKAREQGKSWEYVQGIMTRGQQTFVDTAVKMGLTKAQAQALAKSYLDIPDSKSTKLNMQSEDAKRDLESFNAAVKASPGTKKVTLQTLSKGAERILEAFGYKVRRLPNGKVVVTARTGGALSGIRGVAGAIAALHDKSITITTNKVTKFTSVQGGKTVAKRDYARGGQIRGYATGGDVQFAPNGLISGPGTGTSDDILALMASGATARVSNTEFVVNAASTKRYLPLLKAINDNRIPGFASGGLASGGAASFTYSPTGGMKTVSDVASSYSGSHQPISKADYDKKIRARANAVDSLRAAEARLAQVRRRHHTHAQLVSAENAVSRARRALATATDAAASAEARYKKKFSLSDWGRTLSSAVKSNAAYEKNLSKIASRGGSDVIDQLRDMGAEGATMVAALAKASKKQFNDIINNLRKLGPLAKATLADYTKQLNDATKTDTTFQANLSTLASMGYGDLAMQLAAQGDDSAKKLAADAVKSKSAAKKANDAAKKAKNTLSDEQRTELVQIISAITSSKTGIHDVAAKTKLGEDEIIDVANKAKSQISKSLGSRAAQFLADLSRANQHLSYADGGIRAGLYATRGGIVRFAEPETHGEAYLPLSPSKRRTALPVLADVAHRFGLGLQDAGATRPVVIVKEGGDTHVQVTAVRTGASASDIGAQVGRSVRRARRGGVAARAA